MRVGVIYSGSVDAKKTQQIFTRKWPPGWHVIWTAVPQTMLPGGPQIEWEVSTERASSTAVTYWIKIKNLAASRTEFEIRYAIVN